MADQLSMIAIGAAVGGTAGKLAEKAWDSGERWLRERFGSHAREVQEQARTNVAQFVEHLAKRVKVLEDDRAIDAAPLSETEHHPQFSSLLQRAILNAAQTDDEKKHDMLARLVAARLVAAAETTLALASRLAADAIARSTRRQLTLMALCCFLQDIRPRDPMPVPEYRTWLEVFLKHFVDFEFKEVDARHLVAIACASYDPGSDRDLNILLGMKGGPHCVGASFEDLIGVQLLQVHWTEGLAGVFLTSVGSIVGGLAFDQVTGAKSGMPRWD